MTNSQLPEMLHEDKDHLLTAGSKISAKDIYRYQVGIPLVRGKYYKYQDVEKVFSVINGTLVEVSEHAHRTEKLLSQTRKESSDKDEQIEDLKQQVAFVLSENHKLADHLEDLSVQLENQPNVEASIELYTSRIKEQEEAYSRLAESSAEKITSLTSELTSVKDTLQDSESERDSLNTLLSLKDDELSRALVEIDLLKLEVDRLRAVQSNELSNPQLENEVQTLIEDKKVLENTIKEQKNLIGGLTSDVDMLSYKLDKVTELSKTRIETLEKELTDIKGV